MIDMDKIRIKAIDNLQAAYGRDYQNLNTARERDLQAIESVRELLTPSGYFAITEAIKDLYDPQIARMRMHMNELATIQHPVHPVSEVTA